MRLFPGQYVLILALLSSYAVHGNVVKRAASEDTSVSDPPGTGGPQTSSLQTALQGILEFVKQIPLLGGLLTGLVEKLVELILSLELLTNGAVARLLGGALPCYVSLDNGFSCTGITQNGGLSQLLMNIINTLPDLLVPPVLKNILNMTIKGLIDPLVDVLLGGEVDVKTPK